MTADRLTDAVRRLAERVRADDRAGLPDGHLLTLFVEHRDAAALDALVRRYGPMVLGVCRRHLGNRPDADDAFQAAFLVLVRKAKSVRPRERVGPWLYGVARTTAVRARAAQAKRYAREGPLMDAPDRTTEPVADNDRLAVLDEELGRLPEKYRVPIVLCELGGKTHKEAADQLGWPQGTLAGRLSRGRRMLAVRLARRGVQVPAAALAAAVPGSLVAETVRSAGLFAAGGMVPARVLALTEGVVKAMLMGKLKVAVPVLMALAACAAGGLSYRTHAADEPAKPAKPAEKKAEAKLDHVQKFQLALEKDNAALQGMWVKVNGWGHVGGDVAQLNDLIGEAYLFVDGDRFEMFAKDGGRLQKSMGLEYPTSMYDSGKFSLNPNTVPKQFDLKEPDDDTIYGIVTVHTPAGRSDGAGFSILAA